MDIDCYCDVLVKWPAVKRVFQQVVPWVPYAGASRVTGRPDLDSLNLGNSLQRWGNGLSAVEEKTYASFWAIVGAPIFTGADLTQLDTIVMSASPASLLTTPRAKRSSGTVASSSTWMLTHPTLRAINTHPITAAPDNSAINASTHPDLQTWLTDYRNGTVLLSLFNLDDSPRAMRWYAPQRRPFTAREVWSGAEFPLGCAGCGVEGRTGELQLEPHSSLLLWLDMHRE